MLSPVAIPWVGLVSPPPASHLLQLPVPAGGSVPQKIIKPAQSLPHTGPSPAFRAQGENLPRIPASAALGSVAILSCPLSYPSLCFWYFPPYAVPLPVSLVLFLSLCLHPPVPPGFHICHLTPHSFIPPPSHLLHSLSLRPTLFISLALGPTSSR